jgi:threonine dehydrogenase-like Zn-dependent dehydrogenase
MKALLFTPGSADSGHLQELPLSPWNGQTLRVRLKALGICGTDRELLSGSYGWPAPGKPELVLGHESLGVVMSAPAGCGFAAGDTVVGIVRHPDPLPCRNCAAGEWDMCSNGGYTEHGIKELDGFAREIYDLEPRFAVRVDHRLGELGVLLEPASVVAKAWEHIDYIGARSSFRPRAVVITGAGPVGLLAALMARQRDLEVHILDRFESGPKVEAAKALGATYYSDASRMEELKNKIDIVVECTGSDALVLKMMEYGGPNSVVCLAGVSSGGRSLKIDFGSLNRSMVLENEVVFGSVNANRRHYEKAAEALQRAPQPWLERLVTRRVPLSRWREAFESRVDQIKTILIPDGQ